VPPVFLFDGATVDDDDVDDDPVFAVDEDVDEPPVPELLLPQAARTSALPATTAPVIQAFFSLGFG